MKYFDRRFMLPLITILIGAAMVFLKFMDATSWAALSGTLVSGYMGLAGWQANVDMKATYEMLIFGKEIQEIENENL